MLVSCINLFENILIIFYISNEFPKEGRAIANSKVYFIVKLFYFFFANSKLEILNPHNSSIKYWPVIQAICSPLFYGLNKIPRTIWEKRVLFLFDSNVG